MTRLLHSCLPAVAPAQACSAQLCCKMQVPCFYDECSCCYFYAYSYYSYQSRQSKALLGLEHCHLVQVLDVIHHLDVVETLIGNDTRTPEDWAWVKQLRYYKTGRADNAAVLVKMADAALAYSWEYQGNAPKLVYTPLTDRCYLTLTQVIWLPVLWLQSLCAGDPSISCCVFDLIRLQLGLVSCSASRSTIVNICQCLIWKTFRLG